MEGGPELRTLQKPDGGSKVAQSSVNVSEVAPSNDYRGFLELRDFQIIEHEVCGLIKNTGDKTVDHLVIEAQCLNSQGKLICKKWYKVVPYGGPRNCLKPRMLIRIRAGDHEIPPSATHVKVSLYEVGLLSQ